MKRTYQGIKYILFFSNCPIIELKHQCWCIECFLASGSSKRTKGSTLLPSSLLLTIAKEYKQSHINKGGETWELNTQTETQVLILHPLQSQWPFPPLSSLPAPYEHKAAYCQCQIHSHWPLLRRRFPHSKQHTSFDSTNLTLSKWIILPLWSWTPGDHHHHRHLLGLKWMHWWRKRMGIRTWKCSRRSISLCLWLMISITSPRNTSKREAPSLSLCLVGLPSSTSREFYYFLNSII